MNARAGLQPFLVGRQRELASLWHHFEAAVDGRSRVVLVAGEPGIGKTRLLEAVAERATRAGAAVLRGGASDAEGMPPYLPFLEAFGQHIRTTGPDVLREQTGPLASILATILPELPLRLGQLPASYPLPAEQARLRLYEAVEAFLAAIAAAHPLLLVFDDLQWADSATLDVLCYVARHRPSAHLLVLGAYREGEVEHNPVLGRAITELNRLRALSTMTVGPLVAAEVAALAAGYLGAPLHPTASQWLFTQSEGNPFFAEELLRVWIETSVLVEHPGDPSEHAYLLRTPVDLTLPPSIVDAVRQRLSRLSPHVLDLLRTAAIIGRTFDVILLAEVAGQEVETVEEHLHEAARARLIRPSVAGTFMFSHDKVRESLYEDVTTVRRRRLHGFIGRALEADADPTNPQRLAELAFHFARSGDRVRGASHAQRAAEYAMRAYAPHEATLHYRTTLSLIDAADPVRGDLLLGLGEAAMLAGTEREAVAALEAARRWFDQRSDPIGAARAAQRLGRAWWRQEAIRQARAAFDNALALLEHYPGPELVSVLSDLGSLLAANLHHQAAGIAYSRRALDLAQTLADQRLIAAASRTLGNLLARSNDLTEGISLLERALRLATAADDPAEAAECCACLTCVYFWQGTPRQSRETAMQWLEFAQRCHDPYQLRHVYTWLGCIATFQGDWNDAERFLDQAQAIVERLVSPEPLAYLNSVRGLLAYLRGEHSSSEKMLQEATTIFRKIGPGTLVWWLGCLALVQATQGKVAEAQACMDEVETLLVALPEATIPTAEPLAYLSMTALVLGDQPRLNRYQPKLAAFRGQLHDWLVDRLLGEIATRREDWAAAREYLEAAEVVARREELPWELARTLEAQATLLLAERPRGGAIPAGTLLERALALYQRQGNL